MQKASATGFTYDSYHLWLHKNLTVLNFTTSQDHLSHPLRFMPHHFGEQLAADNKNTEAWRESIKREARLRGGFVRRCTWHNQKVFRAPGPKVQFEVFMAFLAFGLVVYRFIEIMMWTPEHRHEGCCQRSWKRFVQDAWLHVRFLRNGSQISCVKLNLMMILVKKKVGFVALHQLYFRVLVPHSDYSWCTAPCVCFQWDVAVFVFKSIFPLAGAPKVYEPAEWETVKGEGAG